MAFPIPGPQQQQPILVTCSWGSCKRENCQLQPGTAAEPWLCQQLVPDKDPSIFCLSIPQLPILPQLQGLQLPYVPDIVSKFCKILMYCEPHCRGSCSFLCLDVKSSLKFYHPGIQQPKATHGPGNTTSSVHSFHQTIPFKKWLIR